MTENRDKLSENATKETASPMADATGGHVQDARSDNSSVHMFTPSTQTTGINSTQTPETRKTYIIDSPFARDSLPVTADTDRRQSTFTSTMISMHDLGYDTSPGRSRFDETIAAFFHHHSLPADRLEALTKMFVSELASLMSHVNAEGPSAPEVREWKEKTLTRLIGAVMPSLARLVHGLSGEIDGVLKKQGGEVKLGPGMG